MTNTKTDARRVFRKLRLYLAPATAPPLKGGMRDAVLRLLAHLLTSAVTPPSALAKIAPLLLARIDPPEITI